jgi:hypothetical protein
MGVKKFTEGGMSLEEMYPEAKITRSGAQPKPEEYSANRIKVGESAWEASQKSNRADNKSLAPYEHKAEKMAKSTRGGGGSSGTGGAAELKSLLLPRAMKTGGKVSQLSKANGIAKRGLTRGKMC